MKTPGVLAANLYYLQEGSVTAAEQVWLAQASGGQSQFFLPLREVWEKCEQMWNDAGVLGTQKGAGWSSPWLRCPAPAGSPGWAFFIVFF